MSIDKEVVELKSIVDELNNKIQSLKEEYPNMTVTLDRENIYLPFGARMKGKYIAHITITTKY